MTPSNGLIVVLVLLFLVACQTNPEAINRNGQDQCAACKMMISDYQFATELVTSKGRVYKFDAIECLVPYLNEQADVAFNHMLVTDYYSPTDLIDATAAVYLQSPEIDSPMGGHLAAFSSMEDAEKAQQEYSVTIYQWDALLLLTNFQ